LVSSMTEPVIVHGVRTPIGKFGGRFKDTKATELGSAAIRGMFEDLERKPEPPLARKKYRPKLFSDVDVCPVEERYMDWGEDLPGMEVDEVLMGHVLQAGQGQNTGRQASIEAGIPREVPAYTINKICASGMKAVTLAVERIEAGKADAVVAGGMECMSRTPYILPEARWGYRMDLDVKADLIDGMVWDGLYEYFHDYHMGITAENLAEAYGISREEQDRLGVESERRAVEAVEGGLFEDEIIPVEVSGRKGTEVVEKDETPREKTLDSVRDLPPVFKEGGTVTAGNASKISDAAAALLITSKEFAEENGLDVRATVKGYESSAVDPRYMGVGPVPATRMLLDELGCGLEDFDEIELNEAFAAQTLAVMEELDMPKYGVDMTEPGGERINPLGSGISLGHPIGCTGARIIVTQINELERRGGGLGLSHLCVGGGQGMAIVIEV